MIRAGNRAGARRQRIAFRDSCESPICIRRGVSPQLLHSRLTVLAATATHSRLEPLNLRSIEFDIRQNQVEKLILRGFLAPDDRDDAGATAAALGVFLDRSLG